MEKVRATSAQMNAAQLRQMMEENSKRVDEQERYFNEIVEENAGLEVELSRYKDDLEETQNELRKKKFDIKSLKDHFPQPAPAVPSIQEPLLKFALKKEPSPLDCIEIIELIYDNRCTVLNSARTSATKMTLFIYGRDLLDLLKRLVTTYRDGLMDGGDSKARGVFGKSEYAAKESETVMTNKAMRRQRTFDYDGTQVEMFRHLKIGGRRRPDADDTRSFPLGRRPSKDRDRVLRRASSSFQPLRPVARAPLRGNLRPKAERPDRYGRG